MNIFRVRYIKLGGHYHCRLFSAPRTNTTFAKLGDFVCAVEEFDNLRNAMTHVEFLEEES